MSGAPVVVITGGAPHVPAPKSPSFLSKPGPWVELGLTLPIFLAYHLGVVFLKVRNGTDFLTTQLLELTRGSVGLYVLVTMAIGVVFAGVFAWLGRGQAFRGSKFAQMAIEGTLYAILMRKGGDLVVRKFVLAAGATAARPGGLFEDVVMSMGAGFYEELAFRVLLFGIVGKLLVSLITHESLRLVKADGAVLSAKAFMVLVVWGIAASMIFSGVHYVGPLADDFMLKSFVFRVVLGLVLTFVYVTRGFATAVWAHTIYDVWVMVF